MSTLIAAIQKIQTVENLNIVTFSFHGNALKMMSLDLSDTMQVGTKVRLRIKPTAVASAKNFSGELSYSNQLSARVKSMENGVLLSSITLILHNTLLESIITKESAVKMNLHVNDEVSVLINASDLSIAEIVE